MIKSLLVASGLSSRSKPAIQRAVQLATRAGAALTVLHVIEDDLPGDSMCEEIRAAEGYLAAQVSGLGQPQAKGIVATGHATHVIDAQARGCAVGLSGIKHLFPGCVARELMGSPKIDVLAVPAQV